MLSVAELNNYLLASNLLHFVFSAFIVIYIRVSLENRNDSHARFVFKRLLKGTIICLAADMLSYIFDSQEFFGSRILNISTNSVTAFMTVCIGCAWNYFFEVIFHIRTGSKSSLRKWYIVAALFTGALLLVNVFTGWLFYFDSDNVYHRGPAVLISFALQYAFFGVLSVRALLYGRSVRTIRQARLRNSFVYIGLIMLFFGLLQILAGGRIALHVFGLTAGVFIMFLRFQNDQITNDVLTGLNNRYALDTYLDEKIHIYQDGWHSGRLLYLVMMDVNDFKRINDNYGHPEGDKALKTVAQTLKKVGEKYSTSLFIARFGGDEFAAVYEASGRNQVAALCEEIKSTLVTETESLKYRLTIGVGYAVYTGKEMSISDFCARADMALYVDKNGAPPK